MDALSALLFRCSHRNTSRPFTSRQKAVTGGSGPSGTYIVCLDCGKEFPYSWEEMRVLSNGEVEAANDSESPRKSGGGWFARSSAWLSRRETVK
jgi:hypothetical protein